MNRFHVIVLLAAGLLAACGSKDNSAETSGTGTTAASSTGAASVSASSSGSSTAGTTGTDTDTDTTTGVPLAPCVDQDLGSALGELIVDGTNVGAGNDFNQESCDNGNPFDTEIMTSTGLVVVGDSFASDTSPAAGGVPGGNGEDYVVQWTAPQTDRYIFSTGGSRFDTVLSVHPPACDSDTYLACNDDCLDFVGAFILDLEAGETVFVVIEGARGFDGEFDLSITPGNLVQCFSSGTSTSG